jgi:hypothetical protein
MTKLSRISNKQNEDPYLIRSEKLGIVINKCCVSGKFHDMLALTLSRLPAAKLEEKYVIIILVSVIGISWMTFLVRK